MPAHVTVLDPFLPPDELVTFHLTIADRAPVPQMRAAARAISPGLPAPCAARAVALLAEQKSRRLVTAATFL